MRMVFNRMHQRPLSETFHEFLINTALWTLGNKWWKHQIRLEEDKRHPVTRWKYQWAQFTEEHSGPQSLLPGTQVYEAIPAGPLMALVSFGYDLFCLQAKNRLPDFVVNRLRSNRSFQAARYEVAVAAIMLRAGCEISYLDEDEQRSKHCELLAHHKAFKQTVGVEAKSRVRQGVLSESGEFNYIEDWRGLEGLLRSAKKQKPADLPFVIFLDTNLPPSPNLSPQEKPWMKDLFKATGRQGPPTQENPDPYNLLIVNNFGYHFGQLNEPTPPAEWGAVIPKYSDTPNLDQRLAQDILDSVGRYGRIPSEV